MIAWAQCSVCFGVPHVLGIHMLACAQCLVCFMKAYILGRGHTLKELDIVILA